MWLLLPILLGISGSIVMMLFCLVSVGRRADEGEEKILRLISEASHDDIKKNTPAQTSKVAIVR